ncbi:hypothetical protein VNO78_20085 [Psophocarpus tetragonolobus]|uniref:WAT1-related protein n=1 Tax=Psophocarpus tetragonolobus TaxID=3891 RepID=A0AAN9S979_PSOTE
MVLVQVGLSFLYLITKASFNHGLSPYVFVSYRQIAALVVMFPFAYFLERKARPHLTLALLVEIFMLSLLGFEVLDLQNPRGITKVLGTLISLAGALTMTLYKGLIMTNLWPPLIHIPAKSVAINESSLKGLLLNVTSCVTMSMWFIMQAATLKRYPAPLSLTTWMSFLGAAQAAVFTVIAERNPSAWIIGLNIDLLSILYSGIAVAGLIIYALLWCNEKKGPVFTTMFYPLSTILVAIIAYFVLGEKLYLGSFRLFVKLVKDNFGLDADY